MLCGPGEQQQQHDGGGDQRSGNRAHDDPFAPRVVSVGTRRLLIRRDRRRHHQTAAAVAIVRVAGGDGRRRADEHRRSGRGGQSRPLAEQHGDELIGVAEAPRGVLGEGVQDDAVQHRRHRWRDGRGGPRLGRDLLEGDRHGGLTVEGDDAGQELVEDHAHRVEVRGGADRLSLRLLGREVLGGAHDRAGERHVGGARARDAEVGDPRAPLLVEDHVVGL